MCIFVEKSIYTFDNITLLQRTDVIGFLHGKLVTLLMQIQEKISVLRVSMSTSLHGAQYFFIKKFI
jgi:hypothetical protein